MPFDPMPALRLPPSWVARRIFAATESGREPWLVTEDPNIGPPSWEPSLLFFSKQEMRRVRD